MCISFLRLFILALLTMVLPNLAVGQTRPMPPHRRQVSYPTNASFTQSQRRPRLWMGECQPPFGRAFYEA
jgi:hypothetical protein